MSIAIFMKILVSWTQNGTSVKFTYAVTIMGKNESISIYADALCLLSFWVAQFDMIRSNRSRSSRSYAGSIFVHAINIDMADIKFGVPLV